MNYATSAGSANAVAWGNVSGKPSTFTPSSHTHDYLPLSGGTMTGVLKIAPTNVSAQQVGLILHDPGGGGSEACWINWTSGSYSDGVKLMGKPDSKTLEFHDGSAWRTVIHAGNIGSQSVNYATSAGSASSVSWGNVTGKPSTFTPSSHSHDGTYLKYGGWWSNGSGQNVDNATDIIFAYASHGAPSNWGTLCTFSYTQGGSYNLQLHGVGCSNELWFRNRSSDCGQKGWLRVIDSGNIGSQSVNYANSAGSVAWSNVSGKPFDGNNNFVATTTATCGAMYYSTHGESSISYKSSGGTRTVLGAYNDRFFLWNESIGEHISIYSNDGHTVFSSSVYSNSDRRLKKNIQEIDRQSLDDLFNVADKLLKKFTYKQSGKESYGFIAQELKQYIPEAISYNSEGIMSVNYEAAIVKLLAAVINEIKSSKC